MNRIFAACCKFESQATPELTSSYFRPKVTYTIASQQMELYPLDNGTSLRELQTLLIPDDQQEDENDLTETISYRDSVVVNADWTIETINSQMAKGNIDLQPSFQRRNAWDDVRKSRLIESIIVGMPVPNIVLAENKDHKGRFIVIDGKQRLAAINEFMSNKYKLRGLDIRKDLNTMDLDTLPMGDKEGFENSTIRSTVIKNWLDQNFLYSIFFRLNSGSLPLSPQELRKALIGGNLLDSIEEYLRSSASFHQIFGEGLDKRMRDSELVLRFIAYDRDLQNYSGNFKEFLDTATRYYEDSWDSRRSEVSNRLYRLDLSLQTTYSVFGEYSFRKWLGDKYEKVMNRAVFDCVARYFADEDVREGLENPSSPRENTRVIAGTDWAHGQQAARIQ